MTNVEIIASNMMMLIENGTIKENNTINTYIGWKMRGYKIKKGEEHIAEFSIWIKNKKKKEELDEEEKDEKKKRPEFVLTKSYWFTDEQVEPMKKR